MGEKTTGEHSGITISAEDGYGEKVAKGVPLAGGLVKGVGNTVNAAADGKLEPSEIGGLVSDATSFVQSCTDAVAGIASDPIGWLVSQGLNFLITIIQPLQDLIHWVSGDGPALANAAGNFTNIAKGLENFATKHVTEADTALASWSGQAKDVARQKTGDFANGVQGIAAEAGNIAQLLQLSSMVMIVIEDFIKALLSEFVEWLIYIWVPALAAAVPTFGGSTAAAGTATTVKAGTTVAKATGKVGKLQKLLDMIREFLGKMRDFLSRAGDALKKAAGDRKLASAMHTKIAGGGKDIDGVKAAGTKLWSDQGGVGKRALSGFDKKTATDADGFEITEVTGSGGLGKGFARRMGTRAGDALKEQVGLNHDGMPVKPAKPLGHVVNTTKAGQAGNLGEEQTKEEAEKNLDF